MRKLIKTVALVMCVAVCAFVFTACSGKSKLLASPATVKAFSYAEWTDDGFLQIVESGEGFAAKLSESVYNSQKTDVNLAISPVAVYMALALATECTVGDARSELLSALGMDYDGLAENIGKMYRSLTSETKDDGGRIREKLAVTNSVWVDESVIVNKATVNNLADKYYCYSHSADFINDNKNANTAVKKFIKDQTNKLIDVDWNLSDLTRFALVTTLYLKDVWNQYGNDKKFTDKAYEFTCRNGNRSTLKLLADDYRQAQRAFVTEAFRAFYTKTNHGYTIKFILPNDGFALDDVFTAENLQAVGDNENFDGLDDENLIRYNTRCFFPEFKASFNGDLKEILQSQFDINKISNCQTNFPP